MVVNHIGNDGEAIEMADVDECLELVHLSVERGGE
jgi:hypothetical protein